MQNSAAIEAEPASRAEPKSRIVANSAVLMAGQLITWVLTMAFTVYVVRRIGPVGWGDFSIATALTALVTTVAALGIGTLMVRDIARDHSLAPSMIGTALLIRAACAIPCLLVIGFIAFVAGYPAHTKLVVLILSVGMVFQMLTSPLTAGFQAFEHMKYNSFSDVIAKAILSLVSIGLVFAHQGVVAVSVVSSVAYLLVLFLNFRWWRSFGRISLRVDWKLIRYLVIGGLPFWATGVFLTVYVYIDSVMLSFMTTPAVVGYYGVPTKLFATLLFVPVILGTAVYPALSRAYQNSPHDLTRIVRRSFNLLACFSIPVAVGGMILAYPIIEQLYGWAFLPSAPVMVILAACVVPTYLNILAAQVLIATERQHAWTKVMAAACVLNPLINLGLISYFQHTQGNGAYGAAVALLVTESLMMVAALLLLPRGTIGWNNLVAVVKSCAAAALMAPVVWYSRYLFLGVPIALGAVVFLIAVVALRALPKEDLATFGAIVEAVGRKLRLTGGTNVPSYLRWLGPFIEDMRMWKAMGFGDANVARVGATDAFDLWLRYPGVRATFLLRLASAADRRHQHVVARLLCQRNRRHYGVDIMPSVPIGPGFYMPNPAGVTVTAHEIGCRVALLHGVHVGQGNTRDIPRIEDDVMLAPGSRVLGGVCVGAGVMVGARAIVVDDIPAGSVCIGIPARVVAPVSRLAIANGARHSVPRTTPLPVFPPGELAEAFTDTQPVPVALAFSDVRSPSLPLRLHLEHARQQRTRRTEDAEEYQDTAKLRAVRVGGDSTDGSRPRASVTDSARRPG